MLTCAEETGLRGRMGVEERGFKFCLLLALPSQFVNQKMSPPTHCYRELHSQKQQMGSYFFPYLY